MAVKPASRSTRRAPTRRNEENIPFQDLTEDAISQIQ